MSQRSPYPSKTINPNREDGAIVARCPPWIRLPREVLIDLMRRMEIALCYQTVKVPEVVEEHLSDGDVCGGADLQNAST